MRFGQFQKAIIIGNIPTIGSHYGQDHCTPIFFPTSLCGVLVFVSVSFSLLLLLPSSSASSATSSTQLCHTYNFVTHHLSLSHTTLSHTILGQTHNFVTYNFVTHNFVTHHFLNVTHNFVTSLSHLCHIQLCHIQLCHTPSFTHKFVTYNCHTQLCHTQVCHTPAWQACPPSFCVAGVALLTLGWIWWHAWGPLVARGAAALCVAGVALARSCVLRGRRGTYGTGRGMVGHLVAVAALCVAGVALGDIHWRLTWQAWHLLRSIFVLRGRRGTYALCQKDRCIFVAYDVSANAVFFFDFLATFFKLWHRL